MARCVDFYVKWQKMPNFCGKADSSVSEINSYIETLNELKDMGVPMAKVIEKMPEGVARGLAFTKKEDPEVRKNILSTLAVKIKDPKTKKISTNAVQSIIYDFLPKKEYNTQPSEKQEETDSYTHSIDESKWTPLEHLEEELANYEKEMREKLDEVKEIRIRISELKEQIAALEGKPPVETIQLDEDLKPVKQDKRYNTNLKARSKLGKYHDRNTDALKEIPKPKPRATRKPKK